MEARSAFAPWNRFWFERPARYGLAAFRILFGSLLVWYIARNAGLVELLYSAEGVYVPYLLPDLAPGVPVAHALFAAWLALAGLFTLGLWTRIVTPLLLGLHLYHYALSHAVTHSAYDRLILLFLLYLCLARTDRVWSLGARLARDRGAPSPSECIRSSFASRLIQIQLAVFYLGVGLQKLANPAWHTGDVLRFNFQGDWAGALGFWIVGLEPPPWAFTLGAWGVIVLEISIGFGLFSRRLRPLFVVAGAGFHTSVLLVLGFPEFFVCICAYVLFFEDATLRRIAGASAGEAGRSDDPAGTNSDILVEPSLHPPRGSSAQP
ncbi:MAG: HTTM domain-containing protein [Myxococcota bacterium]